MDGILLGRTTSSSFRKSTDPPSRPLRRMAFTCLLAGSFVAPGPTRAYSAITCKPLLSITNVRELRTLNMPVRPWIWKATIVADASYCDTGSGRFEIDFIRIKEYSPDMQFTERYSWTPGQFEVTMELAADESIHDYRIGFIAPCVCRELLYEK
jgi:hypothetical protein